MQLRRFARSVPCRVDYSNDFTADYLSIHHWSNSLQGMNKYPRIITFNKIARVMVGMRSKARHYVEPLFSVARTGCEVDRCCIFSPTC